MIHEARLLQLVQGNLGYSLSRRFCVCVTQETNKRDNVSHIYFGVANHSNLYKPPNGFV